MMVQSTEGFPPQALIVWSLRVLRVRVLWLHPNPAPQSKDTHNKPTGNFEFSVGANNYLFITMRAIISFSIFVSCHELAICPGCRHTFALKTAGTGSEGTCPTLPHHNRSQEKKVYKYHQNVNCGMIYKFYTRVTAVE